MAELTMDDLGRATDYLNETDLEEVWSDVLEPGGIARDDLARFLKGQAGAYALEALRGAGRPIEIIDLLTVAIAAALETGLLVGMRALQEGEG